MSQSFSLSCSINDLMHPMLVEASAGTGKTYAIQNLVARYLVECDIPIEKILLVTFTEAATAELQDRIRSILKNLYALARNEEKKDAQSEALYAIFEQNHQLTPELISERLSTALQNFDNANISTIHGCCQRILKENAFECNALFDTELRKEYKDVTDGIFNDYLRRFVYGNPSLLSRMTEANVSFDALKKIANEAVKKSGWQIKLSSREEPVLCSPKTPLPDLEKILDKEDNVGFQETLYLHVALYMLQTFAALKEKDNFWTFDDLLARVHTYIHGPNAEHLIQALHDKFGVIIIDEFQDTDPIQYEIFHTIAGDACPLILVGDPKQSIYSFRGADITMYARAKSEILKLRENGKGQLQTLDTNYRSTPALINAVNAIFGNHTSPFMTAIDETSKEVSITFDKVYAPENAKNSVFGHAPIEIIMSEKSDAFDPIDLCARKVLELLAMPPVDNHKLTPKDIAILANTNPTIQKIQDKLNAYHIPNIAPQSTNIFDTQEAKDLQTLFAAILSPSDTSLFGNALISRLINEPLQDLVMAHQGEDNTHFSEKQNRFLSLHNTWQQHGFMAMFFQLLALFEIRENVAKLPNAERILTNLFQLSEILNRIVKSENLSPSLLVKFLTDQINSETRENNEDYEMNLESEVDAVTITTIHKSKGLQYPIVLLPDLYTRKCANQRIKPKTYHDADGKGYFVLTEIGEDKKGRASVEVFQESLRLAYVAITRAKYGCYIFWMQSFTKKNQADTSVMDWLFALENPLDTYSTLYENFMKRKGVLNNADTMKKLEGEKPVRYIFEKYTDLGAPAYSPPEPPPLAPFEHVTITPDRTWQITSFSRMAQTATSHGNQFSDTEHILSDDEKEPDFVQDIHEKSDENIPAILKLKAGAVVGSAWHKIMEEIDYTQEVSLEKVRAILNLHGIVDTPENRCAEICRDMVENLRNIPLSPHAFKLADINTSMRRNELEFYFKLKPNWDVQKFHTALNQYVSTLGYDSAVCDALATEQINGFLTGFIDLTFVHDNRFYIIDWKSNVLEGHPDNFTPKALVKPICESFYFMQYLIYCVALMKFIKFQMKLPDTSSAYEKYFGGVFYIFMRGITPNTDRGIFYQKPSLELLQTLEDILS